MKKVKIGITAERFITWGGGVDFISLILNGLNSVQKHNSYELNVYVYIPYQSRLEVACKNLIKRIINLFVANRLELGKIDIDFPLIIQTLKSVNPSLKIIKYSGLQIDLQKKATKDKIDFLLPLFSPLPNDFPIKWAGYIYDFQHKYYPEFFTSEEIELRDYNFSTMMKQASKVIVNAKTVQTDIEKFIEIRNAKILTLPFCPIFKSDFFEEVDITQYGLPKKYFMISNQFWIHKDHITGIKAFKEFLLRTSENNIFLVCTGQTIDYRFPNYFAEIKELIKHLLIEDKVLILGYIPKSHQLQILKHAIAIIQPTLFEGGPGGGAVFESVAYSIPSIVSDIPVNLELNDESVTFFKVGSSEDLADKMENIYKNSGAKYTFDDLLRKNEKRILAMGEKILSVIQS